MDRKNKIKEYLIRLKNGEDLESVRKDFVKEFSDVDASVIMEAEQELIQGGVPLKEVQRLCDIHSSLFHGKTKEEKIAAAEQAVYESMKNKRLTESKGHPLATFRKENDALEKTIQSVEKNQYQDLTLLKDIAIHYAKKGDLLYPLLKVQYGISGPSEVMWTVDDEIRDELNFLIKNPQAEQYMSRAQKVVNRMKEMVYKENNILFPICEKNFNQEEWKGIYFDSKEYHPCFGVEYESFSEAGEPIQKEPRINGDSIEMNGGSLTSIELVHLLNTLPVEITFVDQNNLNKYFNEGPKVFKRPSMALNREVFSCHPPKIETMVKSILEDFRTGKKDKVEIWMNKENKPFLVSYMAVRDENKNYLGTIEMVQDLEFAQKHFLKGEKNE